MSKVEALAILGLQSPRRRAITEGAIQEWHPSRILVLGRTGLGRVAWDTAKRLGIPVTNFYPDIRHLERRLAVRVAAQQMVRVGKPTLVLALSPSAEQEAALDAMAEMGVRIIEGVMTPLVGECSWRQRPTPCGTGAAPGSPSAATTR